MGVKTHSGQSAKASLRRGRLSPNRRRHQSHTGYLSPSLTLPQHGLVRLQLREQTGRGQDEGEETAAGQTMKESDFKQNPVGSGKPPEGFKMGAIIRYFKKTTDM